MFAHFINEDDSLCIGIEAGGNELESGETGARLARGKHGILNG